jgi:hypothetical protein
MRTSTTLLLAAPLLAATLATAAPASAQQPTLTDSERGVVDAYYVMEGVTLGLLGVTALGGSVQLYNLPTALGEGACARGEAILGDYACQRHASLLHGILGIASIASYTATAALALAAPDLDQGNEDTVTDVLGVVHGIGIGVTGALGLLAANPGLIGLSGQDAAEFSRVVRVIHWVVAMVTFSAFATQVIVDRVD